MGCCFLSSSDLVNLDMVQLMPSEEDSASASAALDACMDDMLPVAFGDVQHLAAGEAALQMYETYCAIDVAETAAAVEAVVTQNSQWKQMEGADKADEQTVAIVSSIIAEGCPNDSDWELQMAVFFRIFEV